MKPGTKWASIAGIAALVVVAAVTKGFVKSAYRTEPIRSVTPSVFDETQGNVYGQFDKHVPLAFYECLLFEEPSAMNDAAAQAIAVNCRERNPDAAGAAPAKPSHLFGYSSPAACAADKAKATPSNVAAKYVWSACTVLY